MRINRILGILFFVFLSIPNEWTHLLIDSKAGIKVKAYLVTFFRIILMSRPTEVVKSDEELYYKLQVLVRVTSTSC